MISDNIKNQIIFYTICREVLFRIIEHMISTYSVQHIQLPGAINSSHFCPVQFGILDCKRPDSATGSINKNMLPLLQISRITQSLQGQNGRLRNGRRLHKA
ncbi:hypothetical protein D3C75_937260 [compost metagenome]